MEENNVATEQVVNEQPQEQEPKFTQAEVDKIVQKRLAKEQAKFEQRLNALEESQKLNAMSEREKEEYQKQKEREEFEEERKAFYAERDEFNHSRYKQTIEQQLQSKGLPTEMADLLVGFDAETVASKIAVMEQSFNNQLNATVESKIKSSASIPTVPNQTEKLLSLEEIQGLSMSEYQAHKDLIEKSLKSIYKK